MEENPVAAALARVYTALPPTVTLVAVTKGRSPEQVRAVISAGCTVLGENRVKEAAEKVSEFSHVEGLRWHMIGHLQRNKAKLASLLFDMVQSVDSLRLAKALDRHCASQEKQMPVLIQVNIGQEPQKNGVALDEAQSLVGQVAGFENLKIRGLMCMAPFGPAEQARPYFRQMKKLFDDVSATLNTPEFDVLSMGMTNDYHEAVEEGSTMVRIGREIFDPG